MFESSAGRFGRKKGVLKSRSARIAEVVKAERLQQKGANTLDVVFPYNAGTYEEYQRRREIA